MIFLVALDSPSEREFPFVAGVSDHAIELNSLIASASALSLSSVYRIEDFEVINRISDIQLYNFSFRRYIPLLRFISRFLDVSTFPYGILLVLFVISSPELSSSSLPFFPPLFSFLLDAFLFAKERILNHLYILWL